MIDPRSDYYGEDERISVSWRYTTSSREYREDLRWVFYQKRLCTSPNRKTNGMPTAGNRK